MVSLAHYKIDYKSPLTLYPCCRSWVVVSSLLYPRRRITPHPCRRCRILVVYRRIIHVFVSSSSSSSSSLSSSLYPRRRRRCCCIVVVSTTVVLSFLPRHVRTMS